MKNMNMFIMSMAVSTCIFTAGQIITAESTSLFNGNKVIIDECGVKGQLVREDDGIYARFTVSNETDKDKNMCFYYAANHTPAGSIMSRMGPMPNQVKADECKVEVAAGKTETIEVLIKIEQPPVEVATDEGKELKNALKEIKVSNLATSEYWSLSVAKDPIKKVAGFGGVIPRRVLSNVDLKKGSAVLDSGEIKKDAAKQG